MRVISIPGFTEPVSSLTHLVGAGVFVVLGGMLLNRGRGDALRMTSLAIYVLSCILLLTMSGVYHLLALEGTARAVLERLDHAAIFVFIAGTFTPVHVILFQGWGRWGMLVLIWSAALAGLTLKSVFFADLSEWLGLAFYLVMGWLGTFSCFVLWRTYGIGYILPLIWGGVAYTAGGLVDFWRWPVPVPGIIGSHELFHLAVLLGISLHWTFIWRIAQEPVLRPAPAGPVAPAAYQIS